MDRAGPGLLNDRAGPGRGPPYENFDGPGLPICEKFKIDGTMIVRTILKVS